MKFYNSILAAAVLLTAGGCANLGKPEFTCDAKDKGGVCAGAKDIYELTNHRENLESLTLEELDNQVNNNHEGHAHTVNDNRIASAKKAKDTPVQYEERTLEQHSPYNYQKAKVLPQTRFETPVDNEFGAWPNNGEPLAPEAMAMMSEPLPMRILVSAYKDEEGNLNMPGYVFVNVQSRTWQFGHDANMRPSRVIPLELKKQSEKELEEIKQRRNGVDGLGIKSKSQ